MCFENRLEWNSRRLYAVGLGFCALSSPEVFARTWVWILRLRTSIWRAIWRRTKKEPERRQRRQSQRAAESGSERASDWAIGREIAAQQTTYTNITHATRVCCFEINREREGARAKERENLYPLLCSLNVHQFHHYFIAPNTVSTINSK